jgi:transposase
MYGRKTRVLLREYLELGWTKQALAEKLGVSRRTIYNWVAGGQLDRELDGDPVEYRKRPAVNRKIDPYRGIIAARLAEYPKLSSVRLLEEIRAAGYDGGYSQLSEYVRSVRPSPEPDSDERFETPAGYQGQVDFAQIRLPWGKRYALVVVLGYSRLLWIRLFPRQRMEELTQGLEQAFRYFGGVPKELLFDQMKSVIVNDFRDSGGGLRENVEFLRFANHWGFRIRSCRPYRAKTKGKVERPIRYLRENFLYGREFVNDADLDAQLHWWLENRANVRIHATTGEKPRERFERDEREPLQALPETNYRRIGSSATSGPRKRVPATVQVERRPLNVYDQLVGRGA